MAFRSGGTPNGPVGSGIDCFVMQDNSILGYSLDLNVSEDFQLERVLSLGYFGARDILSLGYSCNMRMGTFLLRGADVAGNVSLPGFQADGTCNINSAGLYTFTALDIHSLIVLFTIMGVKYGGGDLTVAYGSLMKRQTNWQAIHMLPGLATS